MLWLWAAVVGVIVLSIAVAGGVTYLDAGGDTQPTKIEFSEKKVSTDVSTVVVSVQKYDKKGQLEVMVQTDESKETETIYQPESGSEVTVGDNIEGGLEKGTEIQVVAVRDNNSGVIATYTVTGSENTVVKTGSTSSNS